MKKKLILILVALSMLAMFATIAATPAPKKDIRFSAVSFSKGQLIIKFNVTGFTKRTDLAASLVIDRVSYPVKCKLGDYRRLICTAPRMNQHESQPAYMRVGGSSFSFTLPSR